jgi:hypothetical protein
MMVAEVFSDKRLTVKKERMSDIS